MKMEKFSLLIALMLPVSSGTLFAHHGTSGSYEQTKVVTVKGIVKEFRWRNPHSALFLISKDESGKELTYAIEMGSPNQLVKLGYTRATMKPGDEVIIEMHPSFTNPAVGENLLPRKLVINDKEIKFALQEVAE